MLRNRTEAEDASQEVFLRLHRSFAGYDATRPLAPWVARTAYHACLRRLGTAGRAEVPAAPDDLASLPLVDDGQRDPEQAAIGGETSTLLLRALHELPAQDRALVDLRYREGLSDAELAEATGMPVNTVRTRLFRARGRLRGWLAPLLRGRAS